MLQEIIIVKEKMKLALLLFLLWSLVEVHSQTAPYLTFMGETLPDHSYVDLSALGEFANNDSHVVCHTDLTSCCGGDGIDDRGFWYFPNGDVLPGAGNGPGAATNPIVLMRGPQVARLVRGTGSGDVPSGLYRCIIETNADNDPGTPSPNPDNGIGETLYVGVYSTGGMYTVHTTDYISSVWPYLPLLDCIPDCKLLCMRIERHVH